MTRSTSPQCSKEHVLANLTRVRAAVNARFNSDDQAKLTLATFADELQHYPPQAVTAGCAQWARQKSKWPSLSELIEFIDHNSAPSNAIGGPGSGEDFYGRCARLGRSGEWMRQHWPQLEESCRQHMDGDLSDERLNYVFRCLDEGRNPAPRQRGRPMSDAQRMAMWADNDELGANLDANPSQHFAAGLIAGIFRRFRPRREADHPDLAARYYQDPRP